MANKYDDVIYDNISKDHIGIFGQQYPKDSIGIFGWQYSKTALESLDKSTQKTSFSILINGGGGLLDFVPVYIW